MADTEVHDDSGQDAPMTPAEHLAHAVAHAGAASAHADEAQTHVQAAHDALFEQAPSGDDAAADLTGHEHSVSGGQDRAFPGSAQSRRGFPAGSGAARSMHSILGR
jgi:hypothetical protein